MSGNPSPNGNATVTFLTETGIEDKSLYGKIRIGDFSSEGWIFEATGLNTKPAGLQGEAQGHIDSISVGDRIFVSLAQQDVFVSVIRSDGEDFVATELSGTSNASLDHWSGIGEVIRKEDF